MRISPMCLYLERDAGESECSGSLGFPGNLTERWSQFYRSFEEDVDSTVTDALDDRLIIDVDMSKGEGEMRLISLTV